MTTTPCLALPLIEAGQAQKHVTHNEALMRLDAGVQIAVADRDLAAPPASPAEGGRWLVATGATGAWAGADGTIAARRDGAWEFLAPRAGWLVWVEDESRLLVHLGATGWHDLAEAAGLVGRAALADGSLATLGLNTAADAVNRLAVKTDAALFAHDDVSGAGTGDVRIAVAKAAPARDAAVLFETGWSGRALLGLLGGDDFSLRVSADGATWTEALRVAALDGRLTLRPGGLAGGGRLLATRLFTSSATWTRPTGVRFVLAWVLGAGGGGGGAAGGASTGAAGGGGGAGGFALRFVDVAAVASCAVAVGVGGAGGAATGADGADGTASSFGADVAAEGGGGGRGMSAGTWGTVVTGGLGGTASQGDPAFAGAPGAPGLRFDAGNVLSGNGAASFFGGGSRGNVGTVAGSPASARGAGGSGASAASSAAGQPGGVGGDGLVWVWEFE